MTKHEFLTKALGLASNHKLGLATVRILNHASEGEFSSLSYENAYHCSDTTAFNDTRTAVANGYLKKRQSEETGEGTKPIWLFSLTHEGEAQARELFS